MLDIRNLLKEKRLAGIDNGSPEWFKIQKEIILSRPLLRHHYDLWYSKMLSDEKSVPLNQNGKILEIGSGGGYLKDIRPDVITSDVVPGIADLLLDARSLPFPDNSLRAIIIINAFHHIPDVEQFLKEARRCLISRGVLSIIDPAATMLARIFFTYFHPEPYRPDAKLWAFDSDHHMQSSNQALTWIVFRRDKEKFKTLFPNLNIECCEYLPWLSYMATGGVTRRNLVPRFAVPLMRALDVISQPINGLFALEWHIRIRKT